MITQPLTGELVVESSEAAIKSIELQLVRVETCGKAPDPLLPPAHGHKLASCLQGPAEPAGQQGTLPLMHLLPESLAAALA